MNRGINILLVEDNPDDVELTLHALKKNNIVNPVKIVRDGQEALDYLYHKGKYESMDYDLPNVILLDLKLPKISGLEVLRHIKADEKTRPIPVVVLTASQSDRDITESRQLGAATYIVKPVDFHRLSQVTPQLSLNWALLKPAEVRA